MVETAEGLSKIGFNLGWSLGIDFDFGFDFDFDFEEDVNADMDVDVDVDIDADLHWGGSGSSCSEATNSNCSSATFEKGGFLDTWGRETSLRFLGGRTFLDLSLSSLLSSPRLLHEASVGLGSLWSGIVLP